MTKTVWAVSKGEYDAIRYERDRLKAEIERMRDALAQIVEAASVPLDTGSATLLLERLCQCREIALGQVMEGGEG